MTALFGRPSLLRSRQLVVDRARRAARGLLLGGSALYLLGVLVLTIAYHVPRNEALARVHPTSADTAGHWNRYVAIWTAWKHVRAASALAAAAALTVALHVR